MIAGSLQSVPTAKLPGKSEDIDTSIRHSSTCEYLPTCHSIGPLNHDAETLVKDALSYETYDISFLIKEIILNTLRGHPPDW